VSETADSRQQAEGEVARDPVGPGREAEEPTGGDSVSAEEQAIEEDLDSLVEDLKRERDEYLQLAQRARADFENYRKRAAREGADALLRGKTEVGKAVLPALDNLERALDADGDGLAQGVALVHKELVAALQGTGIEPIDPAGEAFDPNLHEALSSRPAEEGEDSGVVAETVQRGYRLGETLIRPARVIVTS
jgi:molecular chaperone GrpE